MNLSGDMHIKIGNRIINGSYIVSYTYTPSKSHGESSLAIMLGIHQGDGAQQVMIIKGADADSIWERLLKEST